MSKVIKFTYHRHFELLSGIVLQRLRKIASSGVRVARIWVHDEKTTRREHETGMSEPY
jgi:hypothetical protein